MDVQKTVAIIVKIAHVLVVYVMAFLAGRVIVKKLEKPSMKTELIQPKKLKQRALSVHIVGKPVLVKKSLALLVIALNHVLLMGAIQKILLVFYSLP